MNSVTDLEQVYISNSIPCMDRLLATIIITIILHSYHISGMGIQCIHDIIYRFEVFVNFLHSAILRV